MAAVQMERRRRHPACEGPALSAGRYVQPIPRDLNSASPTAVAAIPPVRVASSTRRSAGSLLSAPADALVTTRKCLAGDECPTCFLPSDALAV